MLDAITIDVIGDVISGIILAIVIPVVLYLCKRILDMINIREFRDSEESVRHYLEFAVAIGEIKAEKNESDINDEAFQWIMTHIPKNVARAQLSADDLYDLIKSQSKKRGV